MIQNFPYLFRISHLYHIQDYIIGFNYLNLCLIIILLLLHILLNLHMVHLLILLLNPLLDSINAILLYLLKDHNHPFIKVLNYLNHLHNITFFIILKKNLFCFFIEIPGYNQTLGSRINFKGLVINM